MTAVGDGTRVRILPAHNTIHVGRSGVIRHELIVSGHWRVDLDGVDEYGRTLFAVVEESEVKVLDGDMSEGEAQ